VGDEILAINDDDDDDDDMLLQESMVSSPTCTRKQAEAGYRTEPKKNKCNRKQT